MIELLAFGSLEVHDESGRPLPAVMAQPKRAALLTYLALARPRGLHRRDHLLVLFWPEVDDLRARRALNQALSFLRRELGDGAIVVRGPDELGLDPAAVRCDVTAFEEDVERGARAEALELYRGELLAGFHAADAPDFVDWIDRERERLRRLAARTATELAAEERALGRLDSSLAAARRALDLDRFDETALRRVLLLQDEGGDRAGAVRTYEAFRSRLSAQLEIDPSPETQALVQVIRDRTATTDKSFRTLEGPELSADRRDPRQTSDDDQGSGPINGAEGRRPGRYVWAVVAGVMLVLIAAGGLWRVTRAGETAPEIARLAVLPLVNGTTDTTVDAVAQALTQELISSLLAAGVRVIGYHSVARYHGKDIPLAQVGNELGVDAVATWILRRQGGGLQVSLEVARARSGEGLWASTRYAVDSLTLADVAAGAAGELARRFAPRGVTSDRIQRITARATSPEAKLAYLLGMEQYGKGEALPFDSAVSKFRNALALDSTFAPAWAALGLVHAYAIDYGILPLRDACARARPAIERALRLDADLALAHIARARMLQHCDWNWKQAEEEYRRAIALEPSALAYQTYGWLLEWYLGRTQEGVAMGETAVALDPGSAFMHMALAWRFRGAGELDRAEEEARLSLALDASLPDGQVILAEVNLHRGDYATAEREALKFKARTNRSPARWQTLGEIYARTGRIGEARAYMQLLRQQQPMTGLSRVVLARMQLAMGERAAALTTLEQAVADRIFIIPHQPYWDPIRTEPRFQAMMRVMGL